MRFLSSIRVLVTLLLLGAGAVSATTAEAAEQPSRPGFVDSLEPSNRAEVARVVVGREADLVVLSAGWVEGFRTGMNCIVSDGNIRTGEIVLVDVRLNHAVGLILNRPDDSGIQSGNLVTIKTFSVSS
tara:strand:+ start:19591 stop:19974 length:384 start_codon:yes stop_codon:yes gene_type:complete